MKESRISDGTVEQVRILHETGITNLTIANLLQIPLDKVNLAVEVLGLEDNRNRLRELLELPVDIAVQRGLTWLNTRVERR